MSDLNEKHRRVIAKAAAAVRDRGHEGDARLADSLHGILASMAARATPAPQAAPSDDALAKTFETAMELAAQACDIKYRARVASGHPREASTARALAEEIRSLAAAPAVAITQAATSEPVGLVVGLNGQLWGQLLQGGVKMGQKLYAAPVAHLAGDTQIADVIKQMMRAGVIDWADSEEDGNVDERGYLLHEIGKARAHLAGTTPNTEAPSDKAEIKPEFGRDEHGRLTAEWAAANSKICLGFDAEGCMTWAVYANNSSLETGREKIAALSAQQAGVQEAPSEAASPKQKKDAERYLEIQAALLSYDYERKEAMLEAMTSKVWWEDFDAAVDRAALAAATQTEKKP